MYICVYGAVDSVVCNAYLTLADGYNNALTQYLHLMLFYTLLNCACITLAVDLG